MDVYDCSVGNLSIDDRCISVGGFLYYDQLVDLDGGHVKQLTQQCSDQILQSQ